MVSDGNKAKRLSLVNHTTKIIHHHSILCEPLLETVVLRYVFTNINFSKRLGLKW